MPGEDALHRAQPVSPVHGFASLWTLNLRRILAMVLGVWLALLVQLFLSAWPSTNMAGGLITWHPEVAMLLFCGVMFGPLAGLVVGGVSSLSGDLISYHMSFWNWELSYALIGFLAGLSLLVTTRRPSLFQKILAMELASLSAVVVGIGCAAWSDSRVLGLDLSAVVGELLFAGTSDLVNALLFLLPFLAIYYSVRRLVSGTRFSPLVR